MSFLGGLLGREVVAPIDAIGNAFDKIFTSDEERMQVEATLQKLKQEPGILQVELNKMEAQHRSIFVAGWRPFIGWVCGFALAWHFMLFDIFSWASINYNLTQPPSLGSTDQLISIVIALLGLAGYRTIEKSKGVSK